MAKKCMISTLLSQTDSGPHVGRVRTDTMQGGRCYWRIQLCVYGVRKGVGVEWQRLLADSTVCIWSEKGSGC